MSDVKDAAYYTRRLQKQGRALYDELTAGKTQAEIYEMEDELEERTFIMALLARIARRLPDARAYVDALAEGADGPRRIVYVKQYPRREMGKLAIETLTRGEIIRELEDISSESFGDDVGEWQHWIAAFEAEPPLLNYR
ncbi:MAG: hypothetical protein AAFV09_15475 [Pseudomonadota bacterium]